MKKPITFLVAVVIVISILGRLDKPRVVVKPEVPEVAAAIKTAPAPEPPKVPTTHEEIMAAAGAATSDFEYASWIIGHEGSWCTHKWENDIGYCLDTYRDKYDVNDATKGYGLCQSTPAIKMETAGADWRDNPVTQLKWCNNYAISRYGSWKNAYDAWRERALQRSGTYDRRGWW